MMEPVATAEPEGYARIVAVIGIVAVAPVVAAPTADGPSTPQVTMPPTPPRAPPTAAMKTVDLLHIGQLGDIRQ